MSRHGEVLTGLLSPYPEFGTVLFRNGDSVSAWRADQLKLCRYHDKLTIRNCVLLSVDAVLFEQVLGGAVQLLRRPGAYSRMSLDEVSGYELYARFKDQVVPLKNFTRELYPRLVAEFAGSGGRWKRAKPRTDLQCVEWIAWYNQGVGHPSTPETRNRGPAFGENR